MIARLERRAGELGVDGRERRPAVFHDDIGAGWRLDLVDVRPRSA